MARPQSFDNRALLDVARAVFIRDGAEAKTRDIADAAGVSQSLLFQRYRTKQALFFAAMMPTPVKPEEVLGSPPGPGSAAARQHLIDICERMLRWIEGGLPGTLRAAVHPAYPDALERAHAPAGANRILGALADRIRYLQATGAINGQLDPSAAAGTLISVLHGQALAAVLGTLEDGAVTAESAIAVLWAGFAAEGEAD